MIHGGKRIRECPQLSVRRRERGMKYRVNVVEHISYWVEVEGKDWDEAQMEALGIGGEDDRAEDLQVNERDWVDYEVLGAPTNRKVSA
jgi:hypothetical protein